MTPSVEEAFERYHQAVFDFAYRMTSSPDLAADVTQDCFVAFTKQAARFDPSRSNIRTYLFAIATNLVRKRRRDEWRESQLDDDCLVLDPTPSSEISVMVEGAVAMLPPLQREALVLFEYEGLTLSEIARVAEVDIGSVKARLHRARENMKRMLRPAANKEKAHGRTT
jgi:RNA polymerase sigma-70 factor (ECF subfamily)